MGAEYQVTAPRTWTSSTVQSLSLTVSKCWQALQPKPPCHRLTLLYQSLLGHPDTNCRHCDIGAASGADRPGSKGRPVAPAHSANFSKAYAWLSKMLLTDEIPTIEGSPSPGTFTAVSC